MMSYRGGARLTRCLKSIAASQQHFERIVLSITATPDSEDMQQATQFASQHPKVEVICTDRELPTMEHQALWLTHLEKTGVKKDDWIYWLAYDDEVRGTGINELIDEYGNWPLEPRTAYFGPWAMRHEQPDHLFDGPQDQPLESWTSFPLDGPLELPVLDWIEDQLIQPTYMQMSGSVCQFASYLQVRDAKPRKTGPMRIEMATAAATCNEKVAEFFTPVSIIYGRSNSDRSTYGSDARKEDVLLLLALLRRTGNHPATPFIVARVMLQGLWARRRPDRKVEDWRKRATVGT
jgi:hypothetical protein